MLLKYILWRIAAMIPTLLIISALVFTIIELPPGNFLDSQIAEMQAQGETVNTLIRVEPLSGSSSATTFGCASPVT